MPRIYGNMPELPFSTKDQYKLKVINQSLSHKITNDQAAKLLGLSLRQIKRLKRKVKQQGHKAVVHGLKGRVSNNHIYSQIKDEALSLIKEKYPDFGPSFAAEKLKEYHSLEVNPETLRLWMVKGGLWAIHKQSKVNYHAWRERKEYFGQLEQFDGSYHIWFEDRLTDEYGNFQEVCLLASIDDATGRITHAKFDSNESVAAVFAFWKDYVETLGKPLGIYLDKYSTYKINHKNAQDNSELLTQFEKSMKLLSIEVITANSPQAKGRVERLFETLQDRLVKELRLQNISNLKDANLFLKEIFIPKFNSKFQVVARKQGDVHRALVSSERKNLKSIFSIKSQRRVNSDFTIQFKSNFYQLEEIQPVTLRPKEKVLVEEWLNHTIHFKFKGKYLKVFILPGKPKKISKQPAILTNHPLNWKPPPNHPWRFFKFSTKRG